MRLIPKSKLSRRRWAHRVLIGAFVLNVGTLAVGAGLTGARVKYSLWVDEERYFITNEQNVKAETLNTDLFKLLRRTLQIQGKLGASVLSSSEMAELKGTDAELEIIIKTGIRRIAGGWRSMGEELPEGTNLDSIVNAVPLSKLTEFTENARMDAYEYIRAVKNQMNRWDSWVAWLTWIQNGLLVLGLLVLTYANLLLISLGEAPETSL